MTADELMFFSPMPDALPLYEILCDRLRAECPDTILKVQQSQITFKARYGFAFVSLRRMKGCPEVFKMCIRDSILSGQLDGFSADMTCLRKETMAWFRYYSQLDDVTLSLIHIFVKNEQTFKFPLLFSQFHLQFT